MDVRGHYGYLVRGEGSLISFKTRTGCLKRITSRSTCARGRVHPRGGACPYLCPVSPLTPPCAPCPTCAYARNASCVPLCATHTPPRPLPTHLVPALPLGPPLPLPRPCLCAPPVPCPTRHPYPPGRACLHRPPYPLVAGQVPIPHLCLTLDGPLWQAHVIAPNGAR